jgi:hypothetical protein
MAALPLMTSWVQALAVQLVMMAAEMTARRRSSIWHRQAGSRLLNL